ncbi:MAG: acyl-CoA dehydrogenase [Planctomycetota bacterium]|jgi:alkylation response protein AidB-like acyl-CoA dehydrogenase|nr:acyl-CoA dehydrogenase [Planctomycetota bacterium]MDP6989848.1 acyl-CoA dehydrogenase [Planctomycetota bacterium]
MDFELSEELAMVRDMARDFSVSELAPRAAKHDRQGFIDPEVFTQLGELGLWGLTIPEEYGGAGMGNLALSIVLEELNHACASTGVTVSVHNSLLGAPLRRFGTREQRERWLPRLATGETVGCYCLTEPNAGSDAAALATTARQDGDEWVLDGTKIWVTNGGIAGLAIVYARTEPEASRAKGISAFLVPMDTPGVVIGKPERKTGIRGSSTTEVVLEGVRVPAENLLGERDRGFMIAMDTLDGGRIGIASQAVGIGRACLDASIAYARDREQFGRPIGDFQAVQWKIADMATRLDAARLLTHRAAAVRDAGGRCSLEAAQAKLAASTTANFCADECLQIHGGAGYTDDFEVERLFRDARITEIYEGATDIQRIVISRSLLSA